MAFGSSMWLLSIFLIPEAKTYGQMMVIQGIVGGLGVGFLFLPSMSIQSHWFAKRRALAIGIVASGSSVGGVGFPSASSFLSRSLTSFPKMVDVLTS